MVLKLGQGGVLAATVVQASSGTGDHNLLSSRPPFIPANLSAEEVYDDQEDIQQACLWDIPAGLGWDLSLKPAGLTQAFWREQAGRYATLDAKVAWWLAVFMLLVTCKEIAVVGWLQPLHMYGPSWVVILSWLVVLSYPKLYISMRTPILVVVKVALAVVSVHATNGIADKLYATGPLTSFSPEVSLLVKTVLICSCLQIPAEVLHMPLPFKLSACLTVLRCSLLFLGACSRDLIRFSNTQKYLNTLDTSNRVWARMVQSGSLALIVPDASLEGRSASMLLALLTIHVTTCAATMYVAYISQWSEVRVWLQRKANSATARQQSPACPIHIDGVSLSRSQLLHMTDSTAAKVLLDCRGLWGWLSMLLMQGGMLNLVCLGSLLVSQVLALHVGPRMLLQELVALYYPVLPELEGGMCSLDGAPQFPGMLGRFLVFLAGV